MAGGLPEEFSFNEVGRIQIQIVATFRSPPTAKPDRDLALEGLRGLCAILVVYGHLSYGAPMLDPLYASDLLHVDFGRAAVLIFFVISGYVIGLSATGPATGQAIGRYCFRRLLRIVPIAWAAILLSTFLLRTPIRTVIGNLLFLQNYLPYPFGVTFPLLPHNPPLWSLSFEMLYYGLFILVWRYSPRVSAVFAAVLLVSFANLLGFPAIFSRLAWYFVFWLCGLCVAWFGPAAEGDRSAWPSALLGALALWTIGPIQSMADHFGYEYLGRDPLAVTDQADFILASVWVLLAVTRRAPQLQRRLGIACAVLGIGVLPFKFFGDLLTPTDLFAAAVLGLCVLLGNRRVTLGPLCFLAPVGRLSYALYVTAFPLLHEVRSWRFLPSGTLGSFCLRFVVYIALCGAVAWLLERVFQPWIVRHAGAGGTRGRSPSEQPG